MKEIKFDKKLAIRTTGIKEWDDHIIHYNRCEPTPYAALEELFRHYKLEKTDKLVDFGSGKGRVAIYTHHRFQIPVLGVEAQADVISEALQNKERYLQKVNKKDAPIYFEHALAENYVIKPEDNKFFFFNPFSADVFSEVLYNIILSLKDAKREAHIILYYPLPKYEKIMKGNLPFEICNRVVMPKTKDRRDKFIIYKHLL